MKRYIRPVSRSHELAHQWVDQAPTRALIDPWNKLSDQIPEDNSAEATIK